MSHGISYILPYSPRSMKQRVRKRKDVESKGNERTAGCSMQRNHKAYRVAKTTVCMCGGAWVCVLPINTGSADRKMT